MFFPPFIPLSYRPWMFTVDCSSKTKLCLGQTTPETQPLAEEVYSMFPTTGSMSAKLDKKTLIHVAQRKLLSNPRIQNASASVENFAVEKLASTCVIICYNSIRICKENENLSMSHIDHIVCENLGIPCLHTKKLTSWGRFTLAI